MAKSDPARFLLKLGKVSQRQSPWPKSNQKEAQWSLTQRKESLSPSRISRLNKFLRGFQCVEAGGSLRALDPGLES